MTKLYIHRTSTRKIASRLRLIEQKQDTFLSVINNRVERSGNSDQRVVMDNYVNKIKNAVELLKDQDTYSKMVIEDQEQKIVELQKEVKRLLILKKITGKNKEIETIPFTSANYDTLHYKHRLNLERLRELQKAEERAFVQAYDLNDVENLSKFRMFRDNQKVAIREMENKLKAERRQFRRQKYISITQ